MTSSDSSCVYNYDNDHGHDRDDDSDSDYDKQYHHSDDCSGRFQIASLIQHNSIHYNNIKCS